MLTEFGKMLRKLRIDCGEIIKNMADKLGCTASYLLAVETGKRSVPDEWADKIIALYSLDDDAAQKLRSASTADAKSLKIDMNNLFGAKRETAILFAREFSDVDDATAEKIRELLKGNRGSNIGVYRRTPKQTAA
ncbi:MAG: helix-turn-helix domain-containing protein [Oscillospiraceae bacterium]|nr:helix-turn-helix domain-containing protein [Oscillospiraceae bacterium]